MAALSRSKSVVAASRRSCLGASSEHLADLEGSNGAAYMRVSADRRVNKEGDRVPPLVPAAANGVRSRFFSSRLCR